MSKVIAGQLPYLIITIIGIALAFECRRRNPKLAVWGLACYGILTVLWVMEALLIGWVISSKQNGMPLTEIAPFLNGLHYLRMGIRYTIMAALMVGAFRWRDETVYPSDKIRILVAVSIFLAVLAMIIGRVVHTEGIVFILLCFCGLGSDIALMTAFFGWRVKTHLPVSMTATDQVAPAVATPVDVPNTQPAETSFATFEEVDYIPFVLGVMVLGGLVVVPVMWGVISGLGFGKSVFPSLVSCAIFIFAHDKRGRFSLLKFCIGLFFITFMVMRMVAQSGGDPKSMFFAGGILGYIVMLSSGWAGINLARLFRR